MEPLEARISATETRQYRRLVDFAERVRVYAEQADDPGLVEIVEQLMTDLREMAKR